MASSWTTKDRRCPEPALILKQGRGPPARSAGQPKRKAAWLGATGRSKDTAVFLPAHVRRVLAKASARTWRNLRRAVWLSTGSLGAASRRSVSCGEAPRSASRSGLSGKSACAMQEAGPTAGMPSGSSWVTLNTPSIPSRNSALSSRNAISLATTTGLKQMASPGTTLTRDASLRSATSRGICWMDPSTTACSSSSGSTGSREASTAAMGRRGEALQSPLAPASTSRPN
mmetsp:Transcript_8478/g.18614  ORF Transcript_8478/g.18614 Transcript_8478/m.18614 type:complete len:229 (+) Transcript_8478:785-1471(+)